MEIPILLKKLPLVILLYKNCLVLQFCKLNWGICILNPIKYRIVWLTTKSHTNYWIVRIVVVLYYRFRMQSYFCYITILVLISNNDCTNIPTYMFNRELFCLPCLNKVTLKHSSKNTKRLVKQFLEYF